MSPVLDPQQTVAALAARLQNLHRIVDDWTATPAGNAEPVRAAGADPVSALLATQFGAYTRRYQQAAAQAGHDLNEFVDRCRDGLAPAAAGRPFSA